MQAQSTARPLTGKRSRHRAPVCRPALGKKTCQIGARLRAARRLNGAIACEREAERAGRCARVRLDARSRDDARRRGPLESARFVRDGDLDRICDELGESGDVLALRRAAEPATRFRIFLGGGRRVASRSK